MSAERAGTDPNVGVSQADEATVREIQHEQVQAFVTEMNEVVAAVSGMFDPAVEVASQRETTAAIGSGFQFTPEQIEKLIKQCQDLIDQYKNDRRDMLQIARVTPPSPDEAGSVTHAMALTKWAENLLKLSESDIQFLEQWKNTLTQAKQRYMETEHVTADQWTRLAKGLGG
jgi:metal-dependent amidase/aminoacylase/carboxypeptidase family protein